MNNRVRQLMAPICRRGKLDAMLLGSVPQIGHKRETGMDWTQRERKVLSGLRTPAHIQQFLDELGYEEKGGAASPRAVMRTGKAQCFSGVLFACAALRELGHPPRLMYIDAASDDGHCLALY